MNYTVIAVVTAMVMSVTDMLGNVAYNGFYHDRSYEPVVSLLQDEYNTYSYIPYHENVTYMSYGDYIKVDMGLYSAEVELLERGFELPNYFNNCPTFQGTSGTINVGVSSEFMFQTDDEFFTIYGYSDCVDFRNINSDFQGIMAIPTLHAYLCDGNRVISVKVKREDKDAKYRQIISNLTDKAIEQGLPLYVYLIRDMTDNDIHNFIRELALFDSYDYQQERVLLDRIVDSLFPDDYSTTYTEIANKVKSEVEKRDEEKDKLNFD